jgi:hypothetical protein
MPYDALKAPDPQDWLDLGEQERIDQVIEYHRRHHLPMGESVKLHGVAHVVVENQIAFGDSPAVPETLAPSGVISSRVWFRKGRSSRDNLDSALSSDTPVRCVGRVGCVAVEPNRKSALADLPSQR